MREVTRAILRTMETWPWFEHVGEPISDPTVIAVNSWDEAVESRRSYVWECLRLQVNNKSHNAVNARDWHRTQSWNEVVGEINQVLKPLFGRIRTLGAQLSLPEMRFYHQVTWDLLAIGITTEYADVYPPLFSVPVLLPWYQAGHFPCGWDGPILNTYWNGDFPPYRLFVY